MNDENSKQTINNKVDLIDFLALGGIGAYCLLSAFFGANFAKIAIQLPFFNFPIFVSEQLLSWLMILLLIKWGITRQLGVYCWAWGIYIAGILAYAFIGYISWGPYAFRNAALFYYTLFFYFGFSFYNRRILLHPWIYWGSVSILGFCILGNKIGSYYWFSFFVLFLILLYRLRAKIIPILAAVLISFFHANNFFHDSRSHMVSILVAIIFIVSVFSFWIKRKIKFYYLVGLIIFFNIILLFGFRHFSSSNAIKSMLTPGAVAKLYTQYQDYIDVHKKDYRPQPLQVALFCKRQNNTPFLEIISRLSHYSISSTQVQSQPMPSSQQVQSQPMPSSQQVQSQPVTTQALPYQVQSQPMPSSRQVQGQPISERPLGNEYTDILFRFFIWRDMWWDIWTSHSWLGVGFGKPQRSPSIEILGWASTEWRRDGWITPHNSYFHMIYRAGVIGLLVILGIFYFFIRLLKDFFHLRSIKGILCLSIVLYWLVMANFLVIFEFPYNAILIWSLFGMAFAYAQELKRNKKQEPSLSE